MDRRYKHLNREERGVIFAEHRRGGTSIFLTFRCRSSVRPFEVVTGLLIFGPMRGFVSVAWLFAPGPRCRAA
jgi:hypothetical protein